MERITFNQMDHLHSKFTGTGNADTSEQEWRDSQRRDAIAGILAHQDALTYQTVALGLSVKQRRIIDLIKQY